MAERRMLSCKIICSDAYIEIPATARDLYVQFIMAADDDGFLNSPIRVMRTVCATQDDLDILIAKRFILRFPNGVIVIKHWRIHNQIRKDRYSPTQYQNEFNTLEIRDDGAYTEKEKEPMVDSLATTWQPSGNQTATQYRLGKDSIGKDNIFMGASDEPQPKKSKNFKPPTVEEVTAYCKERKNNVNAEQFVDFYEAKGWMLGKNKMKDWKAAVRTWERNGNNGQAARDTGKAERIGTYI